MRTWAPELTAPLESRTAPVRGALEVCAWRREVNRVKSRPSRSMAPLYHQPPPRSNRKTTGNTDFRSVTWHTPGSGCAWSGLSGGNVGYRADVSWSGPKTCPLGHRALPAENPLHAAYAYNSVCLLRLRCSRLSVGAPESGRRFGGARGGAGR